MTGEPDDKTPDTGASSSDRSSNARPGPAQSVDPDAIERAKELLVYAPLGFALYLRDTAPSFARLFVARGRRLLEQPARPATTADPTAGPKVDPTVDPKISPEADAPTEAPGLRVVPDSAPVRDTDQHPSTFTAVRSVNIELSIEHEPALAIADYDDLSASEIVDRLEELPPSQLAVIRDYERGHRSRSTVLGKIEQLTRPASA